MLHQEQLDIKQFLAFRRSKSKKYSHHVQIRKFFKKQLQRIILTQLACPQAVVILAIVACVAAKPGLLGAPLAYTAPLAYSAPLAYAAPAPVVTATSSQVIARNYNGIAVAPVNSLRMKQLENKTKYQIFKLTDLNIVMVDF